MLLEEKKVSVQFAGFDKPASVPRWATDLSATRSTLNEVTEAEELPGVVVLRAGKRSSFVRHLQDVHRLSERLTRDISCRLVVDFNDELEFEPESLSTAVQALDRAVVGQFEFSHGRELLASAVHEAIVKHLALREVKPNRDPLGEATQVIEADRGLRSESGRLSAKLIAEAFDISLSKLATLIGASKQALSKTPDSVRIQPNLLPFERVARLRAIWTRQKFLSWLNSPAWDLDDLSPLQTIEEGQVEVVADFAENIILGNPS